MHPSQPPHQSRLITHKDPGEELMNTSRAGIRMPSAGRLAGSEA